MQYAFHYGEECGASGTCSHLSSSGLWPKDLTLFVYED